MAVFKSWVTTDGFQKVWEHKGISKEIKQVLYAENQRIRTFTRSPVWALALSVQLFQAMRRPQAVEQATW